MATTERSGLDSITVGAVVLGVGIALGGLFAGNGFARARAADRFVTVKGISEREVRADLAIWPLRLVAADNDLGRAHASLQASTAKVLAFLWARGVSVRVWSAT